MPQNRIFTAEIITSLIRGRDSSDSSSWRSYDHDQGSNRQFPGMIPDEEEPEIISVVMQPTLSDRGDFNDHRQDLHNPIPAHLVPPLPP